MSGRGLLSLVKKGSPQRLFRFYPPHYPPPQDVAATMPYWMYPHLDESQVALAEKAKGDWNDLTEEDRLRLYRAFFPVTFAEMKHPPSYGFMVMGKVLLMISLGFPILWALKQFVMNPAPYQLHPDYMKMLEDRMDALHNYPLGGPQGKYYDSTGNLKPREEGGW